MLEGIDEHDWPKVKQVVVKSDIEKRHRVLSLLRQQGFEIAQEVLAEDTGVYNISLAVQQMDTRMERRRRKP